MLKLWENILVDLERSLSNEEYSAWILPLQADKIINKKIILLAANKFLQNNVKNKFNTQIQNAISRLGSEKINGFEVRAAKPLSPQFETSHLPNNYKKSTFFTNLNKNFTFATFVEGKSNQMGLAVAKQIAKMPGKDYNPLFIYGGTGLGKTHLMHSVGHELKNNGYKRVLYVRSESFTRDLISAIQQHTIEKFKVFYQSLDVLLMDDVQLLTNKTRTQEELFHSFNYLLENNCQVVFTSDKYPKEISNIEHRLRSRFSSGLTVAIEPPEYETRVAILQSKAKLSGFDLPDDSAFYIAKLVKSNVRELEGALNNVRALSTLTNNTISISLIKKALKDLILTRNKTISINNIQQTVAKYFNISLSDLLSKSRSRSIVRPRQIAMVLTKELTDKSLPEIGNAFGKRDHTTIIHACKKIIELKHNDIKINNDYKKLLRQLSL